MTMIEFSRSIIGQSAPPFAEDALTLASRTFIFMTCGIKERAACLKLGSQFNRSRWSQATKIGRCYDDTRI
ncbi:hypothetical protein [Mesorhizobium sp. B2-7-2]|uniref:hypothetical protein n=1 Tax=Mesorhizobium sp. B2-7-2 TaxID=2589908 RepID=UPI0015E33E8A|nr:hypothetical protein [Mesorhizobium sp. B2-7-2]